MDSIATMLNTATLKSVDCYLWVLSPSQSEAMGPWPKEKLESCVGISFPLQPSTQPVEKLWKLYEEPDLDAIAHTIRQAIRDSSVEATVEVGTYVQMDIHGAVRPIQIFTTKKYWILFRIGPERRREAGMPTGV
ncbi:hypothetical protein L484_005963 [Morus notabilis]|uniref:Uncharacterized protein n=1 Tax=Morus notabilis TaxID=981085 RepID=W9S8N0_9ROSA|nr:hypothetical protein L484_005963 [Morus notabilis]